MNLVELAVWIFAVLLAAAAAVHAYRLFGLLGMVGAIILGLVAGVAIGTGVTRFAIFALFSKRAGRTRNKQDSQRS